MDVLRFLHTKHLPSFYYAHSEPAAAAAAPTSTNHEGWMLSGQETVFCWVPAP